MIDIVLKHGRDRPVRMGHPWVFSGAIARCEGGAQLGAPCVVRAAGGEILGHGYYNEHSSIAVRMLTRGNVPFGDEELCRRLKQAIGNRTAILAGPTDACRLVNSEGDLLPGLVVDRYGEGLCIQILTAGMEGFRDTILSCLESLVSPAFIHERSDTEERGREKCPASNVLLRGTAPRDLVVREHGLRFAVDVAGGQKTGTFLDQRENRALLGTYAAGATLADCFAYSGAFSVYALAGGARRAVCIDSSAGALSRARENRKLNGFDAPDGDFVESDVFSFLREDTTPYSLIVLDPPKFAKHNRDVDKACRGYKDINLLAMRRASPGAVLFTFSCSQAVDPRLFRQVAFAAAADSGRDVQVLHVLSHPPDHPVHIAHKEGEYLKGLVVRVL